MISIMAGRGDRPVVESKHHTADRAIRALRKLVVTPPAQAYIAGTEGALRSAGFSFDAAKSEWFVVATNGERFVARELSAPVAANRVKLRCPACKRLASGRVLDSGVIQVASP